MRAHQWVDPGRRQLVAAFLADAAKRAWAIFAEIDVNCLQPVDSLLGVLGQVVIGVVYCVSPPLEGSSTANSIVALGGRG